MPFFRSPECLLSGDLARGSAAGCKDGPASSSCTCRIVVGPGRKDLEYNGGFPLRLVYGVTPDS